MNNNLKSIIDKVLSNQNELISAETEEDIAFLQKDIEESIINTKDELIPKNKLTKETILYLIKEAAERFSELRRIKNIFWEHQYRLRHIKEISSSEQEMKLDWKNACVFVASKIFHGDGINLSQIDSHSYSILEEVWLRDIKLLKAYYIWEHEDTGSRDWNYYNACNRIRQMLIEKEKLSLNNFMKIKNYIENNYLVDGRISESRSAGVKTLIARKAHRIWQTTGNNDHQENWIEAKKYVTLFYDNIIPAVIDKNNKNLSSVFEAFRFSKSPENRYLIINSFEAAIAIYFIDKEYLLSISNTPEWQTIL